MSEQKFPSPKISDRIFIALFATLTVCYAIPIWIVRLVPMQDVWQHLALVDVIHNYWAPGSVYPDYFNLPDAPKPNLLYYYLTDLLAYITPTLEIANKVVLTLYVLAFPASFLYFVRSFGRSKWLALFAFPFVYNAMFYMGFVSFALALPMLFIGLGAYRRFLIAPDRRTGIVNGIMAAVLLVAMFFTHAHVYLLAGLLFGALWLLYVRSFWDGVWKIAPFAPSLSFFAPWFWVYFIENTPSSSGMPFGSFDNFFGPKYYSSSQILSNFFNYISNYFRRQSDDTVFLVVMLLLLVLLIVRRAPEVPREEKRRLKYFDLEVLTLLLAASAIVLPHHIQAQSVVSLRHILPAFMFFMAWPIFSRSSWKAVGAVMVTLVIVCFVNLLVISGGFLRFDREISGYAEMFDHVPGGRRLLKIASNQDSKVVNAGALWHIHHLYGILKGGISDTAFAEYPHNPVQYKPGMIPPAVTPRDLATNPLWRYYDYMIVRKEETTDLSAVMDSLDLVAENRGWSLFRIVTSPLPRPFDADPVANSRRKGSNEPPNKINERFRYIKPSEDSNDEGIVPGPVINRQGTNRTFDPASGVPGAANGVMRLGRGDGGRDSDGYSD